MAGKIVFDVGAHIGSIAVWCAVRGGYAVAVEPVPENAEMIRRNALLNDVSSRVLVCECAVGEEGEVPVYWNWSGDANLDHHTWIGNVGGAAPTIPHREATVLSITLSG